MIDRRTFTTGMAALPVAGTAASGSPTVERGYAPTRFGQVHFRRAGRSRACPPLLFFHQVPNSGQIFTPVLGPMARNRRCFAFDTPGYGMSDLVPDPQTIAAYADALTEAIVSLGLRGPVDLLGYHTGAAIAAELANRGQVAVRRVMLVSVPVFDDAQRASLGALTPIPFDEGGEWARAEWQRSWQWRGPGQRRDSVLRSFAEKMRPGARERGAQAIARYDMAGALVRIRQPLMLVRVHDDLWEASARALALRREVLSLEMPGYGHGLWDVATEPMVAAMQGFFGT